MSKITKTLSELENEVGFFGTIFCIKGRQSPKVIQKGRILVVAKRTRLLHEVSADFYSIVHVQKLKQCDLKLTLQKKVIISERNIKQAKLKAIADINTKFDKYFGIENQFSLLGQKNKSSDLETLLMPVKKYTESDEHLIVYDGSNYIPVQCYHELARIGNGNLDLVKTKPGVFFVKISKGVTLDPKHLKIELITQINVDTNSYHSKQVAFHSFSQYQLSKMIECLKNQYKFFSIKSFTIESENSYKVNDENQTSKERLWKTLLPT
jgi:hypothetical protein